MHPALDPETGLIADTALDGLSDAEFKALMADTPEAEEEYKNLVTELSDPDPADIDPPASAQTPADDLRIPDVDPSVPDDAEDYVYDIPQYNGEVLVEFKPEEMQNIQLWSYTKAATADPNVRQLFAERGVTLPADMEELALLEQNEPFLRGEIEKAAREAREKFMFNANQNAFYKEHQTEINQAEAVRGLDLLVQDMEKIIGVYFDQREIDIVKDRYNRVLDVVQDWREKGDPRAQHFYEDRAGVHTLSSDALFAIAQREARDIEAQFIREAEAIRMRSEYEQNRVRRSAPRPVPSISLPDGQSGGDDVGYMPWEELSRPDAYDRLVQQFGEERGEAEWKRQMEYYDNQYEQAARPTRVSPRSTF